MGGGPRYVFGMSRRTPVSGRGNGPNWLLLLLALGLLGLIFATQRTLNKAASSLSAAQKTSEGTGDTEREEEPKE